MPNQEQALHELRMKKAVFQSRLDWAAVRPRAQTAELRTTAKVSTLFWYGYQYSHAA